MGALVLAFTGLTAFIVLQNFSGLSSEVAQSSNTASRDTGSAPIQSAPVTSNASNTAASSSSAANSNSAANISPQSSPEVLSNNSIQDKAADKEQMPMESAPVNQPGDEEDLDSSVSREETSSADSVTLNQPEPENKSENKRESPVVAESQPAPKPASLPDARKTAPKLRKNETLSESDGGGKAKDDTDNKTAGASLSSGRRQISGKTFNRTDGAWYDSAYRNQPTTNVRRGTNDYQKLDSGLRSIANQLDGVVVVVWKTKAYRIQ
jgi:hypothetical protein